MTRPHSYHALPGVGRGFSLIEILVVLVALSIVALIVIPSHRSVAEARLADAGRLLVADLDNARLQSMGAAADPCVVVLDPSAPGYFLARKSDPATPIVDPSTGRSWRRVFGQGDASQLMNVTIEPTDGATTSLAFTGNGVLLQPVDASFTLRCSGRSLTVTTAATGASRIQH